MSSTPPADSEATPQLVAGTYPALPATPVGRTWRIGWPLALPAAVPALIFPRWMGRHVGASSWAAAYLVHFASLIVAVGSLFAMFWETVQLSQQFGGLSQGFTLSEQLRRPLAGFVLCCHTCLDSWMAVGTAALIVLGIQAVAWLGAALFVPMFAAGESRARLYFRCVKLVLWSTACLVPLALAIPLVTRLMESIDMPFPHDMVFGYTFILVMVTWWLSVLLRLGSRYGGPAAGPGWEPRVLRCEACAYELTMLPINGRCPECGRPVADSLPERRVLPAFARERGLWRGSVAYFRTGWAALAATRFARTICVWRGQQAARRFAVITAALVGVLIAGASAPWVVEYWDNAGQEYWYYIEYEQPVAEWWWWLGIGLALLAVALVAGLAFLGWLLVVGLLVTGFGFREAARRSVLLCYSAAWLVVPVVLGIVATLAIERVYDVPGMTREVGLPLMGPVEVGVLVMCALAAPAAAALLLWFSHLRRLLVESRLANG